MNSESLHWSLFHEGTKVQVDGLTFTQIKGVLKTVDVSQLNQWYAWHEGLSEWKLVQSFPELVGNATPPRHLPPFPPKNPGAAALDETDKPLVQVFEMREDGTRVNVQLDKQGFVDLRWNRRFLKSYRVQMAARGLAVDTQTVDISMGGMLLKDSLPLEFPEAFEANLTHPSGQKLRITCVKIPPHSGAAWNRVKFSLTAETELILRTWLLGSDT